MAAEITTLEQPIDAMYLIHKALRGEADRTVEEARRLKVGDSLQSFKLAFTTWATAIMYHAEKELGTEMSKSADDSRRTAIHDPVERAKWALLEKEDSEYSRLLEGAQEVMNVLEEDIGTTSIIPRTKQHLYGQVIALRVAQEDHLETEEAMVLPLIRENFSPEHQLEIVGGLLIDRDADDRRWVIDWISQDLTPNENELLLALESRIKQAQSMA
jgi:hemerythrin-like domain-containing protein